MDNGDVFEVLDFYSILFYLFYLLYLFYLFFLESVLRMKFLQIIEMCALNRFTIVTKTTSCNFGCLKRDSNKTLKKHHFMQKNLAKIW